MYLFHKIWLIFFHLDFIHMLCWYNDIRSGVDKHLTSNMLNVSFPVWMYFMWEHAQFHIGSQIRTFLVHLVVKLILSLKSHVSINMQGRLSMELCFLQLPSTWPMKFCVKLKSCYFLYCTILPISVQTYSELHPVIMQTLYQNSLSLPLLYTLPHVLGHGGGGKLRSLR